MKKREKSWKKEKKGNKIMKKNNRKIMLKIIRKNQGKIHDKITINNLVNIQEKSGKYKQLFKGANEL